MKREVNLHPYKVITTTDYELDSHLFLIEFFGEFFYIKEEIEKVFDVSQMPHYIKCDWVEHNKIKPSIELINHQIKKLNNKYGLFSDELNILKSIRRSLIINKIL